MFQFLRDIRDTKIMNSKYGFISLCHLESGWLQCVDDCYWNRQSLETLSANGIYMKNDSGNDSKQKQNSLKKKKKRQATEIAIFLVFLKEMKDQLNNPLVQQ